MKVKHLLLVALMMSVFCNAWADNGEGGKNIQISFIPYGLQRTTYEPSLDATYRLHYGSKLGFTLGYEFATGKSNWLLEFAYTHSKFDRVETKGENALTVRNPGDFKDLSSYALMYYWGRTIRPGKRFQIPVYLGLGGEVLQGYPFHNFMVDLGAKLRFKFYITSRIAVFAGGTGKFGMGKIVLKDGEKEALWSSHSVLNFDAGITIMFNSKHIKK